MSTDNTVSLNGTATTWPEVLTLAEAAAFLKVSEETLETEIAQNRIPGQRIGDEWRFLHAGLVNWLSGKQRPQQPLSELLPKNNETPEEQEAFLKLLGEIRESWGTIGTEDELPT